MKYLKFITYGIFFSLLALTGCEKDEVNETINVYFTEELIRLKENSGETIDIPVKIFVSNTLNENLEIYYTINGDGASRLEDMGNGTLTIESGYSTYIKYIKVKPIDDNEFLGDAEISITLGSSNPNVVVGIGTAVLNSTTSIIVQEDEQIPAKGIDIFNAQLSCSSVGSNGYGGTNQVTGTVSGNNLTVSGNLTNYSSFPDQTMTLTFAPDDPNALSGKVSIETQEVGTDVNNYEYQYTPTYVAGTYDVNTGEVRISIWIYYKSGSSWAYWYEDELLISTL